jgi:hypothetical protein
MHSGNYKTQRFGNWTSFHRGRRIEERTTIHSIQSVPGGMCQTSGGCSLCKVYLYNPKHLCPKLNGYEDNGQRKVWSSSGLMHCSYQLTRLINVCPRVWYGVTSLLASYVSCTALGNSKENYDTSTSFFVVNLMALCHSQVSLMLSTCIF